MNGPGMRDYAFDFTGFALCRRVFIVSILATAPGLMALPAAAQSFPSKPIRIVIPYGPGSSVDLVPRLISERLTLELGQPVIVENRPGGMGIPAINEVLGKPADGYTILAADTSMWVTVPALQTVSYNFLRDFTPLTREFTGPVALTVPASSPIKSVSDLIAAAKAKPGELNYSSVGVGNLAHLAVESLAKSTGVKFTLIPYKSGGEIVEALLKGDAQFCFLGVAAAGPMAKAGKVRILAVSSKTRFPTMPDVPTIAEVTGLSDFNWVAEAGFVVRSGTPKPVIDKLVAALNKVMSQPDLAARAMEGAVELVPGTPDQFMGVIRDEIKKVTEALDYIGLKRQ